MALCMLRYPVGPRTVFGFVGVPLAAHVPFYCSYLASGQVCQVRSYVVDGNASGLKIGHALYSHAAHSHAVRRTGLVIDPPLAGRHVDCIVSRLNGLDLLLVIGATVWWRFSITCPCAFISHFIVSPCLIGSCHAIPCIRASGLFSYCCIGLNSGLV